MLKTKQIQGLIDIKKKNSKSLAYTEINNLKHKNKHIPRISHIKWMLKVNNVYC